MTRVLGQLSTRARNALINNGLLSPRAVREYIATKPLLTPGGALLHLWGVGETTACEILDWLATDNEGETPAAVGRV